MKIKNLLLLLRNVQVLSFKKGDTIIPQGSRDKEVFFIRRGLVRSYLMDEKGRDISFQLYAETQVFTNAHTLLFNEPSQFVYQALEDTKVYGVRYDSLMQVTANNSDLLELNRNFFGKRIIKRAFQRAESFVFLSPEERYEKFLKDHPKIINRVQDRYIAHVLGITPVSLSRIRNRIANKH